MSEEKMSKDVRDVRTVELRVWQQPVFDKLGLPNAYYLPKMAYHVNGVLVMGMFDSEIKPNTDIYTEKINWYHQPEYPGGKLITDTNDRQLLKWNFNPHWHEEYGRKDGKPNGAVLIPVAEMITIDRTEALQTELVADFNDIMDPETDSPVDQLTGRDWAAIMWSKPVASKKWLNELVQKTFKK